MSAFGLDKVSLPALPTATGTMTVTAAVVDLSSGMGLGGLAGVRVGLPNAGGGTSLVGEDGGGWPNIDVPGGLSQSTDWGGGPSVLTDPNSASRLGLGLESLAEKMAKGFGFGFSGGGFTGPGGRYTPAGIVHRGEYVFFADAVSRIGVDALERWHRSGVRGYSSGGFVGVSAAASGPGPSAPVTVNHAPTYNITPAAGVTPEQLRAVLDQHTREVVPKIAQAVVRDRGRSW